jgi:plasmid stability protein
MLLEEDQRRQLEKRARESGRSMSDLVREVLDEYLKRLSEDEAVHRSWAAIDELSRLRTDIAQTHGLLEASYLDELRVERNEELAP